MQIAIDKINPGELILEARGITKKFPGIVANNNVNFNLRAGEIHVIVGENGAGKTTLMNILYGLYKPDEGDIYIRGKKVDIKSPKDALRLSIGMVHQHNKLIPSHTVFENIIVGCSKVGKIIHRKELEEELKELCDKYQFTLDFEAKIWQLSAGEKQLVEIVRILFRGAKILILDEPTSVLTPEEMEVLMTSLKEMTKNEFAIIPFITHKIPVVLRMADRITVLRKGEVVGTLNIEDATGDKLAEMMIGRKVLFRVQKPNIEKGKEILQVKGLSALNDRNVPAVRNVSFSIREGEIFGIAGVAGNGQNELVETIVGLRKPTAGNIIFRGEDITNLSILDRRKRGMEYIPADRVEIGSVGEFSLVENIAMNLYFDDNYKHRGIFDLDKIRKKTVKLISDFNVVTQNEDFKAKTLSGGNLQKLILARSLSHDAKILVAELPTHGLDVGAIEFVRNQLIQAVKEKIGILFISQDLDEVLSMSDKIAPIYEGEFVDIIPAEKADRQMIGSMISGKQGGNRDETNT